MFPSDGNRPLVAGWPSGTRRRGASAGRRMRAFARESLPARPLSRIFLRPIAPNPPAFARQPERSEIFPAREGRAVL